MLLGMHPAVMPVGYGNLFKLLAGLDEEVFAEEKVGLPLSVFGAAAGARKWDKEVATYYKSISYRSELLPSRPLEVSPR